MAACCYKMCKDIKKQKVFISNIAMNLLKKQEGQGGKSITKSELCYTN